MTGPSNRTLAVQAAVSLLLAFAAVGFWLTVRIGSHLEAEHQRHLEQTAALYADQIELTLRAHPAGAGAPDATAALDRVLDEMLSGSDVFRVKLFSRDELLYHSDAPEAGPKPVDDRVGLLAEVIAQGPRSAVEMAADDDDEAEHPPVFETYVPIDGGEVRVVELYQDYRPHLTAIASARRRVALSLVVGLLVLYVLSLPVALQVNRKLRHAAARLRGMLEKERATVLRLEQLDRMKNAFLSAVSHELRTPLTTIRGAAATLERREAELSADQRSSLLRRLGSSTERLDRLLADLLDVDRLSHGSLVVRREESDVNELVRQAVEPHLAPDRRIRVPMGELRAAVDPSQFTRTVDNLVTNACKYAGTRPTVDVATSLDGDRLVLEVTDDGPGVPRTQRDRIFEVFVRLDDHHPSPGTGVGLSLVRAFAELHGGRAWVGEGPTAGARFVVEFADAQVAATEVEPEPATAAS